MLYLHNFFDTFGAKVIYMEMPLTVDKTAVVGLHYIDT